MIPENESKIEMLFRLYPSKKNTSNIIPLQPLTGNDLLKQNLMKHVNGIAQQTDDDVVINHCIDLKLLIDTIIKKVG